MRALAVIVLAAAAFVALGASAGHEAGARGIRCRPYDARKDLRLPSWAAGRRATLLVDSVLLSAYPGVRRAMPCWHLAKRGRPALMIRIADRELRASGRRVSPLVVVGLGYNSLWERNRRNYDTWAARFDAEARSLIATLKHLGARQIVWVTLRQPHPSIVPPHAVKELSLYSWYFPYVNARLRALARTRNDVVLANWTKAADRPGVTYDSIHCNAAGALLMGRLLKRTIRDEGRRQARAAARDARASFAASGVATGSTPVHLLVEANGDLLIHSPIYDRAKLLGGGRRYEFRPMLRYVRPIVRSADLAICHLETPMGPGPPHGYPLFNTPKGLAPAIKATGWDACSTASNHSLDGGQRAIDSTVRTLDAAGIRHTGSFASQPAHARTLLMTVKGVRVAFMSYTEMTNGIPLPFPWSVNIASAPRIIADARTARRRGAQVVIVNLHWGTEYQSTPSAFQTQLAHALTLSPDITAIVGQHVHVVQPIRSVNGKLVVFGEGNLLSNQTSPVASQDGMIVLLDIVVDGSRSRVNGIRYVPVWVRRSDYTVLPVGDALRLKLADARVLRASYRRTVAAAGRRSDVQPVPRRLP